LRTAFGALADQRHDGRETMAITRDGSPRIRKAALRVTPAGEAPAAIQSSPAVAGVRISHPDRLIYPDLEISSTPTIRVPLKWYRCGV